MKHRLFSKKSSDNDKNLVEQRLKEN